MGDWETGTLGDWPKLNQILVIYMESSLDSKPARNSCARYAMCIVKGMLSLLYNCFVFIVQGEHLQVYCRKYLICILQGVQ